MLFDGSGDYVTTTYSTTDFDWWTQDFVFGCWVYAAAWTTWSYTAGVPSGTYPCLIGNAAAGSSANYWSFGPISNGKISFAYYNGSNQFITSSGTISTSTWTHIALAHKEGKVRLYINGDIDGESTFIGTPQSSNAVTMVLGQINSTSITGYVDEICLIKGNSLYIDDFWNGFTVPAIAYADTQSTISGGITESLAITNWRVNAHRVRDGAHKGTTTSTGTTYSINVETDEICNITLSPHIDRAWTTGYTPATGEFWVPSNPDTTPHLFECTTSGAVGGSEPTWNTTPSATTSDGSAVWTCVGPLPTPKALGPRIPS